MAVLNGRARMKNPNAGLNVIVSMLSQSLRSHVNDDTGLAGKYDFDLFWSDRTTDAGESGPDLVTAIQEQLGLKLERKKGSVEVIVVDHAEKTPTVN